jgi:hypothetical protein
VEWRCGVWWGGVRWSEGDGWEGWREGGEVKNKEDHSCQRKEKINKVNHPKRHRLTDGADKLRESQKNLLACKRCKRATTMEQEGDK